MYQESKVIKQRDAFSSPFQYLPNRKLKMLEDPAGWHNLFHREITAAIPEECFKVLYSDQTGRPNAPIRVLVAMIILKVGQGWTDEQLFEEARFNLKVMQALGLAGLGEDVPVESTYYDFQKKLTEYHKRTGLNLMEQCFLKMTMGQIKKHKVLTDKVRMDSKLIQSNIANCSRAQLIIQTLSRFYKGLTDAQKKRIKKKRDKETLDELIAKTPSNHTFEMTNEQKEDKIYQLGHLIRKLLSIYQNDRPSCYGLLERLYKEQYTEVSNEPGEEDEHPPEDGPDVRPKARKEIGTDTMQSAHDEDAAYRTKGHGNNKQMVRGYLGHVTESCGEGLRLITEACLVPANQGDDQFLVPGIEKTEKISGKKVTDIYTDGGYDSINNRNQFSEEGWKDKNWHLGKTKGALSYHFEKDEHGDVVITDLRTGTTQKVVVTKKGKYRIHNDRNDKNPYRYFNPEVVESHLHLSKVRGTDQEELKRRANVEATIHQVFCKLNGNKSRYRGLIRNAMMLLSRVMWVNFRRIANYIAEKWKEMVKKGLDLSLNGLYGLIFAIMAMMAICTKNRHFC